MAQTIQDITTDEELERVFHNTNFGKKSKRDLIAEGVLKRASGYWTGHTLQQILLELELIEPENKLLTSKGREYLYLAFEK